MTTQLYNVAIPLNRDIFLEQRYSKLKNILKDVAIPLNRDIFLELEWVFYCLYYIICRNPVESGYFFRTIYTIAAPKFTTSQSR